MLVTGRMPSVRTVWLSFPPPSGSIPFSETQFLLLTSCFRQFSLPETNIAPENKPSQEKISSSNHQCSPAILGFREGFQGKSWEAWLALHLLRRQLHASHYGLLVVGSGWVASLSIFMTSLVVLGGVRIEF